MNNKKQFLYIQGNNDKRNTDRQTDGPPDPVTDPGNTSNPETEDGQLTRNRERSPWQK